MSISLVHGDMLKSVSKNFHRNIYSNFTLTKKTCVSFNNDETPLETYIRMFSGLNNYIWFFQSEKTDEVTYYFGQAEKDRINNDSVNVLEPLKPSFSVNFNLKTSNLSNGRFFTDEEGNIIGNILVNRLKDKQYDLLKKLGFKINIIKNKQNNENKHLISFYNTKDPEKSLKILEKLINNIVFQNDENNNLTIIKIHENLLNQDSFEKLSGIKSANTVKKDNDSVKINNINEDVKPVNRSDDSSDLMNYDDDADISEDDDSLSSDLPKEDVPKTGGLNESDYEPYVNVKMDKFGHLEKDNGELDFTILEVRDIHESYNEGQEISEIAETYDSEEFTIKRIVARYNAGDFNKFIIKVLKENPTNEKTSIKIKNNNSYTIVMDKKENILNKTSPNHSTKLFLNLKDIVYIIEEYNKNKSIESIGIELVKNYDIVENVINRVIAGNFKQILPEGYGILTNTTTNNLENSITNALTLTPEEYESNIKALKEYGESISLNKLNNKINSILNNYNNTIKIEPDTDELVSSKDVETSTDELVSSKEIEKTQSDNLNNDLNQEESQDKHIINEVPRKESLNGFKDLIRERLKASENNNIPYTKLKLSYTGHLKEESTELNFTILDAKNIHEAYNEGQEIEEIIENYPLSKTEIERIILRYDAGDFNECLTRILIDNPSNLETPLKIDYNVPYHNLEIDNEGNVLNSNDQYKQAYKIRFTVNDIKILFEEYENNRSIKSLSEHFKKTLESIQRIINRIIAGDFNQILHNIKNPNLNDMSIYEKEEEDLLKTRDIEDSVEEEDLLKTRDIEDSVDEEDLLKTGNIWDSVDEEDLFKTDIIKDSTDEEDLLKTDNIEDSADDDLKPLSSNSNDNIKTNIKEIRSENEDLKLRNQENNNRISGLIEEYNKLSKDYNNELKILRSDSYKLKYKVNSLEKENKSYKTDLLKIDEFETKIHKLENENHKLKNENYKLESENYKLEKENDDFKKDLIDKEELENKITLLEKRFDDYKNLDDLSDFKEEFLILKTEKIDLERELKKKSDEIEKLTYKNRKSELDYKKIIHDLNTDYNGN